MSCAPLVIAEIGCNHKGDINVAKMMLEMAKRCGCTAAKFQKRCPKECLSNEQYHAPHPNPIHSYGSTYGEHREALEFTIEQHAELQRECQQLGITYSASVWDCTSANEIISLKPPFIKVGSPSNLHFDMMALLRDSYTGDVHISTGMTTEDELEEIIQFWEKGSAKSRVVLYSCTSAYPVKPFDVCLKHITQLQKYSERVKSIGFSGHHIGISIDLAAVALGARWIERHFTVDKTWKGTDHSASLDENEMKALCEEVQTVAQALNDRPAGLLDCELSSRAKLKWVQELQSSE